MSNSEKVYALRAEYKEILIKFLEDQEDQKFKLFDLSNDEWRDDDELFDSFYELPREYVYGKYNYATIYMIYTIYLKDGNVYFEGIEDEDNGDYTFEIGDLFTDTLAEVVDSLN